MGKSHGKSPSEEMLIAAQQGAAWTGSQSKSAEANQLEAVSHAWAGPKQLHQAAQIDRSLFNKLLDDDEWDRESNAAEEATSNDAEYVSHLEQAAV